MTNPTNETEKKYPQVRIRPETLETLKLIKTETGWSGTEAMHRIFTEYARRKRICPKAHEASVAGV